MTIPHHHTAIVGTGFAGLGAAIALSREGVDYTVLERARDVGGTWRDNRYPGCRCDVPSHLYSFSFAPNPDWSETYSPQPEIQAYLRRTAEDHGVMDHIRFGHEVLDATWDDAAGLWHLTTASGPLTAEVLLLGNGPLAEPKVPDLPGLETFEGTMFHSAQWRTDHDLAGQRVAVIGTGASAIQFVPEIQPLVGHLTVFQRTAPWVLPHSNRRITGVERALYRRVPAAQRFVRAFVYWTREVFGRGLVHNGKALQAAEKVARKMLHRQVPDPELRRAVTPDYRPGCKRLILSDDWYPALQQDNVELVTEKVIAVRPNGVLGADGVEHAVDTIIFGTGFHVTDNPVADRVHGVDGVSLAERWLTTGAQAHLGTTVPGFPNLFLLAGPNTGIGHTSLVVMIESQLAYVVDALHQMQNRGLRRVDLRPAVLEAWTSEIQAKAAGSVWNAGGCASWYLDDEGRNTTIWPDQTYRFRKRTQRFDIENYVIDGAPAPARRAGQGPGPQGDEPYGEEPNNEVA